MNDNIHRTGPWWWFDRMQMGRWPLVLGPRDTLNNEHTAAHIFLIHEYRRTTTFDDRSLQMVLSKKNKLHSHYVMAVDFKKVPSNSHQPPFWWQLSGQSWSKFSRETAFNSTSTRSVFFNKFDEKKVHSVTSYVTRVTISGLTKGLTTES